MLENNKTGINNKGAYFYFLILVTCLWNENTLMAYVKSVLIRIPGLQDATYVLFAFVYIVLIVFSLQYIQKYIRDVDIFLYIIFVLMYLLSLLCMEETNDYLIQMAYNILIVNVPTYFVGLAIPLEDKRLSNWLHITSIFSVFLHIIVVAYIDGLSAQFDNLEAAYRVLPHVCMVLYFLFKKFSWLDFIATIVGFFQLFIYGTRGPMVLVIAFGIICYILKTKNKYRGVVVFGIIACSSFVFVNLQGIALFLKGTFGSLGFNTRIFDRIIQNTFLISDGRDFLKELVGGAIAQRPFLGYGVAGDRGIIKEVYGGFGYVHDLLYEMIVSYGWILGTVILVTIAILLFRTFLIIRDREDIYLFLVLFFSSGFLKLFLSSSYLLEAYFFMLMGICVSTIRRKRHKTMRTSQRNKGVCT